MNKTLFSLTMMQLKDKLDMSKKSKKFYMFKIVFNILKFIIITGIIFVAMYVLAYLKWLSLDTPIPVEFLIILVSVMLTFELITCTIKVMDSLYFGKDNTYLLTVPVTKSQLFISKLLLFFIYELIKNIYYFFPIFIAYGMVNGYLVGYYIWLVPCWLLFTLLVVALSGLLSIPSMLISMVLKRNLWLKTIFATILLTGIVLIVIKLISILPDKFNFVESWPTTYWKIQDFFKIYSQKAIIFTWLTKFVVGTKVNDNINLINIHSLYVFIGILATLIVVLTISVLLIKPLFFKMASYPFEYRKNEKAKIKENIQYPSFFAFLKKEFLLIIRTPSKFNTLLIMAIVTPLSIFLMNKIYLAMDVRDVGKWMIMAFNILMISLMVQSTNSYLATSFSEEGPAFYLSKINPNKYSKSLVAKLVFNIFLMTVSILTSVIIFSSFRKITFGNGLLIFLIIEGLYVAHAFWSAELDIMNPFYNQYSTVGSMITNPNEIKSTLLGFVLSILLALFTYINLSENQLNQTKVWIKLLIIVGLFLAYRVYMYFTQIKLYFKEK